MQIDGACHCGRIRFSALIAEDAPITVCHCSDCQQLSGAPLRAVVSAPIEHFQLQGQPRRYVKQAQSGRLRAQVFCPDCGTALYGCAAENPDRVLIRLGCVRQRELLRPTRQIWCRSAQPWLATLGDLPASPEG